MDRRIKFRHLEVFGAIARTARLKRAAEQLNLTQPAVSKTLRELEDIVGQVLARRDRSGVQLTPEGELFLQYTEQSTSAIRHGLQVLQRSGATGGRLKIGALPSVASSLVPLAVKRFVTDYPDTMLEVSEGPHTDLTSRLRSGDLDLVVGRLGRPESMNGLSFSQLYTEEVVAVSRPDSPAVSIRSFHELDAYRVVYPPRDSAIRPLIARMLIAQGVPLFSKRIETASASLGMALVLSDPDVVWFISAGVVAREVSAGNLLRLDLDMAATTGAVGVMTRAGEIMPPTARALVRYLNA